MDFYLSGVLEDGEGEQSRTSLDHRLDAARLRAATAPGNFDFLVPHSRHRGPSRRSSAASHSSAAFSEIHQTGEASDEDKDFDVQEVQAHMTFKECKMCKAPYRGSCRSNG